MQTELTDIDFIWAADKLGCSVAAIRAVAATESRGSGFLANGKPKILFERHLFHRLTKGKFAKYPDISSSRSGGYTRNEYARLEKARSLDDPAALKSASWGLFQILGSNYKACGFDSVEEYVIEMTTGAKAHLAAFVSFIKADNRLHKAIINRQWSTFASIYNGPKYKRNRYDTKMAEAYNRFVKEDKLIAINITKKVQTELKRLGLYTGLVDGDYGPNTKNAIIAFEKNNQLAAIGKITPALISSMFPDSVA